ncbi:arginine repressor [Salinivibrio kushneri]|uniref:Arginine repressor n=1 Tax=Salinivibrio kushneri TaxID=1908198 RepID=A0AA47KJZ9_9GAMM|nr:arginine repressor [Salinivibrio kushneri]WBA08326.1 arginine repressor [Salinivibrio kushneri]
MVKDAILSVQTATPEDDILSACRHLLQTQSFTTQDAVRQQLVQLGYLDVSQSTVSRLLSKLGVAKVPNAHGQKVYALSGDMEPVYAVSSVGSQIDDITCSQAMVVVKTHPGGAQLIARLLDLHRHPLILGTVGGNDTVLVAPRQLNELAACEQVVRDRLAPE